MPNLLFFNENKVQYNANAGIVPITTKKHSKILHKLI